MKKLTAALLGLGTLLAGTWNAHAAVIGLTSNGATALDGSVRYTQTSPQPTGTGVIGSFVRFQSPRNSTTEQAYNTTVNNVYNNTSDNNHNRAISVGGVGFISTSDGAVMRFLLDINEPGAGTRPLLNVDEIQVHISTVPNQSLEPTLGQGATIPFSNSALVYQLDAGGNDSIVLDASLNSGSGSGDMFMDIPLELFLAAFASNPVLFGTSGAQNNAYIYLYTRAGDATGGFEEWAAIKGAPITPPPVPEPATALLMALGLMGLVAARRRNKYTAQVVEAV